MRACPVVREGEDLSGANNAAAIIVDGNLKPIARIKDESSSVQNGGRRAKYDAGVVPARGPLDFR